jgi:hypothetical protein
MVIRFTHLHQVGLLQLQPAAMWNTSLWVVAAAVAATAAVVAAEAGMDQKELAGPAAPAGAVVATMLLRLVEPAIHQPLPHRKGTMAPLMREAGPIKSVVAAVEQELPAQPGPPAVRQEMAEQELLLQSVEHLFIMQVEVVVNLQSLGVQAMVALEAEALEAWQALQTLVAAVVPTPAAARAS